MATGLTGRADPVGELGRVAARRLAALGAAELAVFGAVYLAFVQTAWGREVDEQALVVAAPEVEVQRVVLFDVGPVVLAVLVLGVVAVVRRGWWWGAVVTVAVGAGSVAAETAVRVLPQATDVPAFPSGDATLAASVAVGAVLVAAPSRRRAAAWLAASLPAVVGVLLVGLGWHRPSEDLAGVLLGSAAAVLVVALALVVRPEPDRAGSAAVGSGAGTAGRLGGALTVLGVAVVVVASLAAGEADTGSALLFVVWAVVVAAVSVAAVVVPALALAPPAPPARPGRPAPG